MKFIIIFIIFLTSCTAKELPIKCTEKQLELVEKENEICTKNLESSNYYIHQCFKNAKISHCRRK